MKAHLTRVSLALLSVVFILACQDQGSGPVGPDGLSPQFDKAGTGTCGAAASGGHCHGGDDSGSGGGSPFYEYTFSDGDITTEPATAGAEPSSTGGLHLHGCCGEPGDGIDDELLTVSSDLLVQFSGDVAKCFGGIFPLNQFSADLRPDKRVVNGVHAVFHFEAWDVTGAIEANYILRLIGTFPNEEIFPPEVDQTTTVTFTDGFITGGKQTKHKDLCVGEDLNVNSSVAVKGRPDDLDPGA